MPISSEWCEECKNGRHHGPDSKYPASTVSPCHPPSWNLRDQVAKEERREDPTCICVIERVKGVKKYIDLTDLLPEMSIQTSVALKKEYVINLVT